MEKVVKEFVSSVKTISENGKTIERLLRELRDSLGRLLEGVVEEIRPQLKTNVEYQTSREVKIEKEILPVVESCCDGWLHDGKRLHLGLSIHYHRICLWVKADQNRHVLLDISFNRVGIAYAEELVVFLSKNVCSAISEMIQEALKKCESAQNCAIERLEKMVKAVKKMSVPARIAQASSS